MASHIENTLGNGGGHGSRCQDLKSLALPASVADCDESWERDSDEEIVNYWRKFQLSKNLLELQNLTIVSNLGIQSVIGRKNLHGIQSILDYPKTGARLGKTFLTPEAGI